MLNKELKSVNLLIATPAYGSHVHTDYLHSMLALVRGAMKAGIGADVMTIGNESLITRGRNSLISYFHQKRDYSHIVFIDADVGLENQTIPNLLKRGVDVIGCPVPLKGTDKNGLPIMNIGSIYSVDNSGLAEVEFIGTAVLMLSRKAVSALVKSAEQYNRDPAYSRGSSIDGANYNVFKVGVVNKVYLSEDFFLCKTLRELGFKVYADMTAIIKHSGTYEFLATKEQIEEVTKWRTLNSI